MVSEGVILVNPYSGVVAEVVQISEFGEYTVRIPTHDGLESLVLEDLSDWEEFDPTVGASTFGDLVEVLCR